jgi:dienelactone hydrolase
MPARPKRRLAIAAIACAAVTLALVLVMPRVRSLAVLLDLAGMQTPLRRWLPVRQAGVEQRDIEIPTRHGAVRARIFEPDAVPHRALAVFPGIHSGGVDEPRLVAFSRRLASAGYTVVTVPLPDLRVFRITVRTTDMIEDAARWIAESPIARGRRIGLAGISFAGGLSIVAAGRPALAPHLAAVLSVGGHGDLPRTLQALCEEPLAHVYALAVLLLAVAPEVVPADQVAQLELGTTQFLHALAQPPERGNPLLDELSATAQAWPEPATGLVRLLLDGDAAGLCRAATPHIAGIAGDPALSPERAPMPRAPVFLLHGDADRLIPSTETLRLAADLRGRGHRDVRAVVTPAIVHAELGASLPPIETWRMVQFLTAMFALLDR